MSKDKVKIFRRIIQPEMLPPQNHVQAFIDNVSVPQSVDELLYYIENHGWYNVEDIMHDDNA